MKHEKALQRLKNIEGHIRGVERMIEEGVYCIDIIRQLQAVEAALSKVNSLILSEHMNSCLITAIRGEDMHERERVLNEIIEVFDTANKN